MHMSMLARGLKDIVKESSRFQTETAAELCRLKAENGRLKETLEELDPTSYKTPIVILNSDSTDQAKGSSDIPKIVMVTVAEFTMNGYGKHKRENASWCSPAFYTYQRGNRMCLEVCANGDNGVRGQYLSITAYFMHGEFDSEVIWPFQGDLVIELVNQGKGLSLRHTLRYTKATPKEISNRVTTGDCALRGKGVQKFVHLSELPSKFLKNDSLRFTILRYKMNT